MLRTTIRAAFAALALGLFAAAPAHAGTATFHITGGNVGGSNPFLTYDYVTVVGNPFVADGVYTPSAGTGTITSTGSSGGTYEVSIAGTFFGTPVSADSTFFAINQTGPGTATGRVSIDSPLSNYVYFTANLGVSGGAITGGTLTLASVPEPSSVVLGGTALGGLALAARRRRAVVAA